MELDKQALDKYLTSEPPESNMTFYCDYSEKSIEPYEEVFLMENGDLVKLEWLDDYIKEKMISSVVSFKPNGDYKTVKAPEAYFE